MGQSLKKTFLRPTFTEEQLHRYQDCTYFTRKEILRLYKRFSRLSMGKIDSVVVDVATRLSFLDVQNMPELRQNPFKERLCQVFSTDGEGINFEDFMDMFSVLSEHAPYQLKAAYAFRIYDFNNDNAICIDDIRSTIKTLTDNRISEDKLEQIASHVIGECDVISDGNLSYSEFEHMIIRSPDFASLLHVTI